MEYHMEYLFALQTFNLPTGRHIQAGRDKKRMGVQQYKLSRR